MHPFKTCPEKCALLLFLCLHSVRILTRRCCSLRRRNRAGAVEAREPSAGQIKGTHRSRRIVLQCRLAREDRIIKWAATKRNTLRHLESAACREKKAESRNVFQEDDRQVGKAAPPLWNVSLITHNLDTLKSHSFLLTPSNNQHFQSLLLSRGLCRLPASSRGKNPLLRPSQLL